MIAVDALGVVDTPGRWRLERYCMVLPLGPCTGEVAEWLKAAVC